MTNPEFETRAAARKAVIRTPDPESDLESLVGFFKSLPEEQQNYLRYDITRLEGCQARLKQVDNRHHFRLIAEVDGRIVADGTLDREVHFWSRHMAELRCVLSQDALDMGIGPQLIHGLVAFGHKEHDIELLYTMLMPEQTGLIELMKDAGFVYEATRKRAAKDIRSQVHDLVIYANDLERVWSRLEEILYEQDTPYLSGHY